MSLSLSVSMMLGNRAGAAATPSYDPDAEALFARFTTPPTTARKGLINNLIVSLKDAGVWTKLDALYVMAAADSQAARQNWIADQYNLTPVAAPTFNADRGYTPNGSSSYLATGLTPGAGQYALNDCHIGVWSLTNSTSASAVIIGARTSVTPAGQGLLLVRTATDTISPRLNQDSPGGSLTNTDSSGHIVGVRSGTSAKEAYRNAISLGTLTDVSTSSPAVPFFIGALNNAGTASNFDARQVAAGHLGASLSAANNLAVYNALHSYLVAVGASS